MEHMRGETMAVVKPRQAFVHCLYARHGHNFTMHLGTCNQCCYPLVFLSQDFGPRTCETHAMALHAAALDHMREGLTEFLQEQVLEDFGMLDPKGFGFTEKQWQARLARLVDRAHHRAQRCGTPEALVSLALEDLKGELLQAFLHLYVEDPNPPHHLPWSAVTATVWPQHETTDAAPPWTEQVRRANGEFESFVHQEFALDISSPGSSTTGTHDPNACISETVTENHSLWRLQANPGGCIDID